MNFYSGRSQGMNSQAESNNESSDRDIADPFQVSSTTDDMLMKSKYIYYININLSFYCFIYLKYYITFFFFYSLQLYC